MKAILLALAAIALWVAVLSEATSVWDADMARYESMDRCLAGGGSPSTCMEVQR